MTPTTKRAIIATCEFVMLTLGLGVLTIGGFVIAGNIADHLTR